MARNKKPRKAYRPRPALTLPITYALPDSNRTDLQLPPHIILDGFVDGTGTESGCHTLIAAINVGAVLARTEDDETQGILSRALDAIQGVKDRGEDTGRWGMSGDQYRAIAGGLALTSDMQDRKTRREVRDAIDEVRRTADE